ncbi:T6SS phospholipase effector Tle1-like catalytic domain-containing protein [Oricola sp.]|uniref:T6SS phospholipase effector Tle1-like catalytic domain-containing protein n=1 Tax=Oricola sp. TaxID=1979950 RepID=UPI003BABFDB7
MPKNIVILCDGTSNQIEEDRTNILRLYGCLRKNDRQVVFYDPGVGTFGGENDWLRTTRKTKEVWGLATGWGLDHNVKEAYRFLVEHFDPGKKKTAAKPAVPQDDIYIFGFSRGAYTASVLAGFIHAFGIMDLVQINLLDYAYRTYKGISERDATPENPNAPFLPMRLYERALTPHRPDIKALGLFDTVASVIELGKVWPQLRTHPFTRKNPSVQHVRRAVAIDERRTMFNPVLWELGGSFTGPPFKKREAVPQDAKEVWFSGVHGDVGGGYEEEKSAQAKLPLLWMIREMEEIGLKVYESTVRKIVLGEDPKHPSYVKPGVGQKINISMTRAWRVVEFLPRKVPTTSHRARGGGGVYIPRSDHRSMPENAEIHESVFERMKADPSYRPVNLPASALGKV